VKVFVMPLSLAVSAAEARAIEGFVRGGGVVIADGAAALLDEHCAWPSSGRLDGLFGISGPEPRSRPLTARAGGPVVVTAAGAAWGLDARHLEGLEALEPSLNAAGADVLARIGDRPALLAHRLGRGWAIDLNVLFDRYPAARRNSYGGAAYRALVGALLDHVGVRPAVDVRDASGAALGRTRIARYRFGGREVVAALEENLDVATLYGRDGVTVYEDSRLGRVAKQEVTLRLPALGTVTNVRTGAALGRSDTIRTTLTPGDALVLAIGDGPTGLTASGPARARRGERVAVALASAGKGPHLVRCHVYDPQGAFRPEYAQVVRLDEAGTFVLPLALNDPAGRYRLEAADVLTGATARREIEVD
jgi:hypothetical protein